MNLVFNSDRMKDAAKEFLRVTAGENLILRLIASDSPAGAAQPSTGYIEPDDPFYAPQGIPHSDWEFTQVNNAVRALGPTCVFAFQFDVQIYGFWLHRPDSPDDWVIQLRYSDAPHNLGETGGAEVVSPALLWFTGIQIPG